MSAQWSEEQIRMLINERKNGNEEYHRTPNRNKRNFWEDIANEINRVNNTNYFTGEDCNKKFLALTRAYYTARAYKKAVAEANAEALLEGSDNTETNEGDKAKVKKKRSTLLRRVLNRILERTWYLFLLYSRVYEKDIPLKFLSFLGARHSTTPSNTPGPLETGSDTSSSPHKQTKSSRPVTPSTETPVVSRPVTPTIPSFSQNANVINVTINYGGKGSSSEEQ
ncbi:hypothetical protein RhiirA1_499949 [Rhizophagus irregularis]|uniref:Myb/SANT-like DNA-binding domain-containing protein n=1 Tax=Rhizophagus irregularis TaxID=588596 RepID=A0A2N0R0H6_9GLOM|nr:hypothetical protein RhiirA1_499949 [Rhizophagus irregularis]CAB4485462.1 unnamed protein product [Rhizophagus irregularis]